MFPYEACEDELVHDPISGEPQPINVIASYTLTEQERENCRLRLQRFTKHDDRYESLRQTLLSIGGLDVLLQRDDHLPRVLDDGVLWTEAATTADGDKYASHLNAAQLYNDGTIDAIGHGWALSTKTGLWHHHTWGIVDETDTIVETTADERAAYYGIELRGAVETGAYTVNLQSDELCQGD